VFQFAGGQLAMQPTTVRLGQDETRIVLTLSDVDAADLIASLNVPDLAATGRLEGAFPLRLTARTAFVENGELHALPGGGILSYTGNAGQNATGVTRVAFDALRGFDYDALTLRLNGDISGDVLTEIEFSGKNSGRAVDLGPVAPVPGLGNVSVRGVPFDFNVRITAPFRRLAQTAASITDPGTLINRATGNDEEVDIEVEAQPAQPAPVDPQPPGTR
jgi:translocation and assembly module TamB